MEKVLVIARANLAALPECGLTRSTQQLEDAIPTAFFMDRDQAENDPSHKQLIPYTIMRHDDAVMRYQRSKGGKETRLHNNYSLGVGGHINQVDTEPGAALDMALVFAARDREVAEEFRVNVDHISLIGLLNDDTTEVGQVHVGVVFECWLKDREVSIVETDRHVELDFVRLAALGAATDTYETWSRIIIDDYLSSVEAP